MMDIRKLLPEIILAVSLCIQNTQASSIVCDEFLSTSSGVACYKIIDGAYEWDFSQNECKRIGGNLVTIKSQQENDLLQRLLMANSLQDVWLGMQEMPLKWGWLDGREVRGQGCFYDNLTNSDFAMTPQFIANNSADKCIRNCASVGYEYAALHGGDFCLCGNKFGKYGQTNALCNMQCRGAASLRDYTSCGGASSNEVFSVHGEYSNWQPGQPNDHLGYQTCAVLDGENDYLWNDVECQERHGSICYLKNILPKDCVSESHLLINDSCYYLSTESKTFFEGRMICYNLNGELAFFLDGLHERQIVNHIKNNTPAVSGFWIGLVRWKWEWITREEVQYSNWAPNQPNGVVQHCASMDKNYGFWSDEDCSSVHRVLCKIDNSTIIKATTRAQVTKFTTSTAPTSTTTPTTTPIPTTPKPNVIDKIKEFYENNKIVVYIIAAAVGCFLIGIIVCCVMCRKKSRGKKEDRDGLPEPDKGEEVTADHFFGLGDESHRPPKDSYGEEDPPDVIPRD